MSKSTDTFIIYESREKAWLSLLTSEIKSGKIYARHYKNSEGQVDLLMAYGTKDCNGYPGSKESLKVIHGESPIVVEQVFKEPVFPSEVTVDMVSKGETYFFFNTTTSTSELLTRGEVDNPGISYSVIEIPFDYESYKLIYETLTGTYYFAKKDSLKALSDFATSEDMTFALDNISGLREDTSELQRAVFPLTITATISPIYSEIGTEVDVTLNYTIKKKGVTTDTDVTNLCTVSVTDKNGQTVTLTEDKKILGVNNSNTYTINASYSPGYDCSISKSISFVEPMYWKVISEDLISADEIYTEVKATGTKLIQPKSSQKITCNLGFGNSLAFVYPASYGELKSITDKNGFDYMTDYTVEKTSDDTYYIYRKISKVKEDGFIQTFSF